MDEKYYENVYFPHIIYFTVFFFFLRCYYYYFFFFFAVLLGPVLKNTLLMQN